MAKLPRLSGAEVVKALEALGFAVVRQRGSHIVMRRDLADVSFPIIANSRPEPWLAY